MSNRKSILTLSFALLSVFILVIPTSTMGDIVTDTSPSNSKEYYAFIGGCMKYQNESWNIANNNSSVDSYHRYVYNALLKSKNWKQENIVFLTDEQASQQAIYDALSNLSNQVDENDIFLFSWHSHGNQVLDENGDEAIYNELDTFDEVISPYDIDVVNGELVNYISDDILVEYLDMFHCEAIIVNIEACFSGGFADDIITEGSNGGSSGRFVMLSNPENNLEWIHPWVAWGWMSSLGLVLSSPISDRDDDGWISAEEAFSIASPMYSFRSYLWIYGMPFTAGFVGFQLISRIIDFFSSKAQMDEMVRFMLSILVGVCMITIIEHASERDTGYPSSNRAISIDAYNGNLPLIQL